MKDTLEGRMRPMPSDPERVRYLTYLTISAILIVANVVIWCVLAYQIGAAIGSHLPNPH